MKNKLMAGLASGLFLFCMVGLANATLITQQFYIEIESVAVTAYPEHIPDFLPTNGEKFFGTVTYDNVNISQTGTYIIGQTDYSDHPGRNEAQDWHLDYPGITSYGFELQNVTGAPPDPLLHFMNGILVGMTVVDNRYVPAYMEEVLGGKVCGSYVLIFTLPGGDPVDSYVGYEVNTSLHILPVPEPATMLLLSLALMGLAGVRKKIKN